MENLENGEINKKTSIRKWAERSVIGLLLAVAIPTFVVQAYKIPTGSMEPTLEIGDYILVSEYIYGFRIPFTSIRVLDFKRPQRGDVIVFISPLDKRKDLVKRVVAVGGETVHMAGKKLYINGVEVPDSHAVYKEESRFPSKAQEDRFGPIIVPQGSLFVLGDNRDRSSDSRFWGSVPLENVKGKAVIIYWSWNSGKLMVRFRRLGQPIY